MTRGWRLAVAGLFAAAGILSSGFAAEAAPQKQKIVVQKPVRVAPARVVAPKVNKQIQINRNVRVAPRNIQVQPKIVAPAGARVGLKAIGPGPGKTVIAGRNYSVWRGGPYRRRYGGGWRTFVALSTLAAITIGAAAYYPYAYIDAPADYCQGLTPDGCQLRWAEVPTVEGYPTYQCVAYCPWQ